MKAVVKSHKRVKKNGVTIVRQHSRKNGKRKVVRQYMMAGGSEHSSDCNCDHCQTAKVKEPVTVRSDAKKSKPVGNKSTRIKRFIVQSSDQSKNHSEHDTIKSALAAAKKGHRVYDRARRNTIRFKK